MVAGSVVLLAGLLFAGWAWTARQAAARAAAAARFLREAISDARVLHAKAREGRGSDLADWVRALEAGRRAEASLDEGEPDPGTRVALRSYLETMRREGRVAEAGAADRRVVERLAECRLSFGEHYDRSRNDALFAAAFREYGIDVKVMDPAKAGELIGSRPIRDDLVGALDEWIYNQQEAGDQAGVARLLRVATAADPDPGRAGIRAALASGLLADLQRLANSIDPDNLSAITAQRLAYGLRQLGDATRAIELLRHLRLRHPGDFWINVDLANRLNPSPEPAEVAEAVRYATAAVALRPTSPSGYDALVWGLVRTGRLDEAVAEYRELIRNDPGSSVVRAVSAACWRCTGGSTRCRAVARGDPDRPRQRPRAPEPSQRPDLSGKAGRGRRRLA